MSGTSTTGDCGIFADFRFGYGYGVASHRRSSPKPPLPRDIAFLLQPQHNPVHCWPWGPDALCGAKRTNKPILLSVGYSASLLHFPMAHESFEEKPPLRDDEFCSSHQGSIARTTRQRLIYMNCVASFRRAWRLALTMFLAPDGSPFLGRHIFSRNIAIRPRRMYRPSCAKSRASSAMT